MVYLRDVVYNGFFGFEMMTERDLESMICGICGITPEICLGDGNEKNCCSVGQVQYCVLLMQEYYQSQVKIAYAVSRLKV